MQLPILYIILYTILCYRK